MSLWPFAAGPTMARAEVTEMDEAVKEARTALGARDYELIAEGFAYGGARIAAVLRRRDELVAIVSRACMPSAAAQTALSRALMAFLTARQISEVHPRFEVVWQEDGHPMRLADAFPFDPH